jgi:hypothetical protein
MSIYHISYEINKHAVYLLRRWDGADMHACMHEWMRVERSRWTEMNWDEHNALRHGCMMHRCIDAWMHRSRTIRWDPVRQSRIPSHMRMQQDSHLVCPHPRTCNPKVLKDSLSLLPHYHVLLRLFQNQSEEIIRAQKSYHARQSRDVYIYMRHMH